MIQQFAVPREASCWYKQLTKKLRMYKYGKDYVVLAGKTLSSYLTAVATIVFVVLKLGVDLAVPWWVVAVIIFVGLLVGQFRAFNRVSLERDELAQRLDNRPAIDVLPLRQMDDLYLQVKNVGEAAEFTAQIQTISTNLDWIDPSLKSYKGWWQQAHGGTAKLNRDQFDRIMIARHIVGDVTMRLRIFFYDPASCDPQKDKLNWCESPSWMPLNVNRWEKPEYELQLNITSNPSLKEAFSKRYKLASDGLTELEPG